MEITSLHTEIESLTQESLSKIELRNEEIHRLEEDSKALVNRIETLLSENRAQSDEALSLKDKITFLEVTIADHDKHDDELLAAQKLNSSLHAENSQLRDEIEQLKAVAHERSAEVEGLMAEREDLGEQVTRLRELGSDLETKEREIHECQERIRSVSEQLNELSAQKESLNEEVQELRERNVDIEAQLRDKTEQVKTLNITLQEISAKKFTS